MSTNRKLPLNDEEIEAFEATCNLADDLLQAGNEMRAGLGQVVYSPLIAARENTGLTRQQFAALLGISTLTLESWEQDRKQPIGAVRTLIAIALSNPEALIAVAAKNP
ncbi:helix-turn-helix domain-containing protein [Duganella sp. CT11-25]|uniref:helix-turn-helix domain-containing protein n=1 Tax=unclassified Duganella TaxID=2636909 RepID=UPI0039B05074